MKMMSVAVSEPIGAGEDFDSRTLVSESELLLMSASWVSVTHFPIQQSPWIIP